MEYNVNVKAWIFCVEDYEIEGEIDSNAPWENSPKLFSESYLFYFSAEFIV